MIDVHVLTHEGTQQEWLAQCLQSLEGHPVNVVVIDNTGRSVGEGRARGYAMGLSPFVAYVDSDDYVLPGCFAACLEALGRHHAVVTMELVEYPDGSRYPFARPGHAVTVYRREDVIPWLEAMARSPHTADAQLSRVIRPIQIAREGYVWRVHPGGDHHKTTQQVFAGESGAWPIQTAQQ